MATQHLPETEVDSECSTPRSDQHPRWNDDVVHTPQQRVRFMCSFGGRILPRPHDNQLRYVGGETRIVAVHRSATFASLLVKLAKLAGYSSNDFAVKYQLPTEDLDSLISVSTDEDVDNMIEEYDRLCLSLSAASAVAAARTPRLRLFLFPHGGVSRSSSSISSLLDGAGAGSTKQWFVDALNGSGRGSLERVRSEVSSVVSEVPDYLFGLDNDQPSETAAAKTARGRIFRGGSGTGDGNESTLPDQTRSAAVDPGSPAPPVAPPVYFSTSSTTMMPPSDLPLVKTKLETAMSTAAMNNVGQVGVDDQAAVNDMRYAVDQQPPLQRTSTAPILMWPPQQAHYYPEAHHLQGQMPVYYMQTPGGNVPVRPVQMAPSHSAYMHGVAGQPTYYGGQPMMVNQMGAPPAQAPVYGGQILRPGMLPAYPPPGAGTDHFQVINSEAKTG